MSHYFSERPDTPAREITYTAQIRGRSYSVKTATGMFSPHEVDKGTAVFFAKVPQGELKTGALAVDVGCGWGPMTLALAAENPDASVLAVDVNERALAATKLNVETAGLTNVTVQPAPEALAELLENGKRIDLLWSNPPIRIGKAALHQLLIDWLGLLADDGVAYLVVQRNLGADSLTKWLGEQGFAAEKIGSAKGFRIIRVQR